MTLPYAPVHLIHRRGERRSPSCRPVAQPCRDDLINPETRNRRSVRLRNYDYALAGAYFVTMIT